MSNLREFLFHAVGTTVLVAASPAAAQFGSSVESAAALIPEVSQIAPGTSFAVALSLEHPDGWHSYYRNSGGVELPVSISWELPDGFSAGDIKWPTPEVKDGYFGKSFIYNGNPVFLTELKAPESLVAGSRVSITADAEWQICEKLCKDEAQSFTLTLAVGDETIVDPAQTDLFARARAALPKTPGSLESSAEVRENNVQVTIKGLSEPAAGFTDFIPNEPFAASVSSGGKVEPIDGGVILSLPLVKTNPLGESIDLGDSISGILIGEETSIAIGEIRFPSAESPTQSSVDPSSSSGFPGVLVGMFLGGLILNLMPCVFPVIGLKIMGFVQQAGEDHKKVMLHGVIFTLGVLASFAVLSALLFAFQSSWGFQLQNPWVVLGLMVVMLLLALNMSGVFEIGASATSIGGSLQAKQGLGGTFFSGVLATVVATPCSAPFLGTAMAAAVNLPPVPFFAAFAAMAIGLSTPYLVLSLFPKLVDFLPRPGPWMESFKQAMAFPLYGTAGYLLWVYASQIDLENLLEPVFGLCLLAMAAWIHGRWNVPGRSRRARLTALILTVGLGVGGLFLASPPAPASNDLSKPALVWETWSEERVESALAEGTPVYIDFTAAWCATCQVNKKRAYTEEVVRLMQEKGVLTLKADKTKANPEIDRAIDQYGRAAIPVNVLEIPGKEPVILPELLSPDDVLEALKTLPDE